MGLQSDKTFAVIKVPSIEPLKNSTGIVSFSSSLIALFEVGRLGLDGCGWIVPIDQL